jgi:hypothetical protein
MKVPTVPTSVDDSDSQPAQSIEDSSNHKTALVDRHVPGLL